MQVTVKSQSCAEQGYAFESGNSDLANAGLLTRVNMLAEAQFIIDGHPSTPMIDFESGNFGVPPHVFRLLEASFEARRSALNDKPSSSSCFANQIEQDALDALHFRGFQPALGGVGIAVTAKALGGGRTKSRAAIRREIAGLQDKVKQLQCSFGLQGRELNCLSKELNDVAYSGFVLESSSTGASSSREDKIDEQKEIHARLREEGQTATGLYRRIELLNRQILELQRLELQRQLE